MAKLYCILAFFGAFVLVTSQGQFAPRIFLYEGLDQTGKSLVVTNYYIPDLSLKNFNNRIQSVCATGTWLFYDEKNYNEVSPKSGMEWIFGPAATPIFCANLKDLRQSVSSLRYAGSNSDIRADSITLFSETYFQGKEEYFQGSAQRFALMEFAKSLIITGTSGWTVYDQEDYKGNSICVFPKPTVDFRPELISSTESIDIPHGTIKSLRIGCK